MVTTLTKKKTGALKVKYLPNILLLYDTVGNETHCWKTQALSIPPYRLIYSRDENVFVNGNKNVSFSNLKHNYIRMMFTKYVLNGELHFNSLVSNDS